MYICPLCNQLGHYEFECPTCEMLMEDRGRMMDYFDNYSAYLDIEGTKMVDGFLNDRKNHECPHVLYCLNCRKIKIQLISEKL